MDVDVLVALGVAVGVDVGLVDSRRPGADLVAEALLRVPDHVIDGLLDRRRAVPRRQLLEPSDADPAGPDLGAYVAHVGGQAVVGLEHVQDVAALLARLNDLDRGETDALGPHVEGVHGVAAGGRAAGVAVMALNGNHEDKLAVGVEDRGEDVVVGQVPAAVVGVVGEDHVPVGEAVLTEEVQGEAHRQRRTQHELRNARAQGGEPSLPVHDRGVALVRLVEDRRRGGQADVGGHLDAGGLHRPADDLGGHRVDVGRPPALRRPPPRFGELGQVHWLLHGHLWNSADIVRVISRPPKG